MAEVPVALLRLRRHFRPHLTSVIAMKRIALDIGRLDALAAKDLLEGPAHRRRARA
jgi:hypothetical protein